MTVGEAFSSITGCGDDFSRVVAVCESLGDYCLIGGLAINCYVEPVYTMDADFVVTASRIPEVKEELESSGFQIEDFTHSLNAVRPGSQLRIQFTKDARYKEFPARAEIHETLGQSVRVASLRDLVQAKIWAWSDQDRRLTKRKKDELDLIRIAEKYPEHLESLPTAIRSQISLGN